MTTLLSAQVLIASTDYSSHLLSLTREATLDTPGAKVSLVMNDSFPFSSVDPWDDLVVYENGTKTMTGYVTHIIAARAPAQTEVQGFDTYKRCLDWFISDNLYTGGPDAQLTVDLTAHSLSYYVGYLCDLCGISYVITDSTGTGSVLLKSDVPLGLRSVSEALITLSAVGQWNLRVDPNGVLQFEHINGPTAADYTLSTVTHYEEEINDTDTRNQVKIWGLEDFNPLTSGSDFSGGGSVLYSESRDVAGVPHTRPMVFAGPFIDTIAKAQLVATAALDQWARLEHLLSVEMVGNPNIRVGQSVQYFHRNLTSGSYFDVVTDIRSTINRGGYKQDLTTGRRAYRYPYWPLPRTPPVEWGGGIVNGVAYDCCIYGDSVYSAGQSSGFWRVERRLLRDGSLVWGRTINHRIHFPLFSSVTGLFIYGISVSVDGVFVTGDDEYDGLFGPAKRFVECYRHSDGSTVWTNDTLSGGGSNQDISVTGTAVFVIANGIILHRVFSGIPYTVSEGPSLWSLSLSSGVSGSHFSPVTHDTAPDGNVIESWLSGMRSLYHDGNGSFLTCGLYKFPYHKNVYPGIQPPDPYDYHVASWYAKISLGGTGSEVKGLTDLASRSNSGGWLATSVDLNSQQNYIVGTNFFAAGGTPSGGLTQANSWHTNIQEQDPYCHMEIGKYVFVTNTPAIQWYRIDVGSYIGQRSDSGVSQLHGIQLYAPTSQMAVCGQKDGLFWTGLWDQPL